MMDGVEAPEERKSVKGAVDPILGEVRQHQDRDELRRQRHRSKQGEVARGEQRVRLVRSKNRCGETSGEVQAEDTEETERAAEHRTDPSYPAGAQVGGLVVAENPPEVAVERGGRRVGRGHACNSSRIGRLGKKRPAAAWGRVLLVAHRRGEERSGKDSSAAWPASRGCALTAGVPPPARG